MTAKNNESNVLLGFLRTLLDRRDWVYLLSLLIPFFLYSLALKSYDVTSQPGDHGLVGTFDLMRSDVFFGQGYALLWIGIFTLMRQRKGSVRWVMVFLFHITTVFIVLVSTCAHWYFQETGTKLDYDTIAEWIPKFDEIEPIFARDVPLFTWALFVAIIFYGALGPLLVTRTVEWWRGWPGGSPRSERPKPPFWVLSGCGFWRSDSSHSRC